MKSMGIVSLGLCACSFTGTVRSTASYEFSCPEDQVNVIEISDWMAHARGCGKDAVYNRSLSSPLRQAVYDLSCPANQLHMVALGNSSVGVEGCGKKTSYVYIDQVRVGH